MGEVDDGDENEDEDEDKDESNLGCPEYGCLEDGGDFS